MSTTRRLQTKLRPAQAERVVAYANAHLITVSAAIRILLARALDEDPGRATEHIALASLIAAEQALLVLGSMFPDGDRRLREQAERAAEAAGRRLAQLSDRLSLEEQTGA